VWRITETLKNTSEEIVAKEINKEAAKTSNDLSELKDLINEDYVSKKGIKIDWNIVMKCYLLCIKNLETGVYNEWQLSQS
jgi:hypothetical protein